MPHKVTFQDINRSIEVPEGVSILEAAEEAGIDILSSCRKGQCGTCAIQKVQGEISVVEGVEVAPEMAKKGMVLSCASRPLTDLVCKTTFQEDEYPAKVTAIIDRTPDTKSFHLQMDTRDGHGFEPGQFLTVGPVIDGKKQFRCYSTSSSCFNKDYIEITIKRQKKGLVSNFFHDFVELGKTIHVKKPKGNFKLDLNATTNLLLIGSGSGITPLISMIRSLTEKKSSRKINLLYGNRSLDEIIFHKELLELEAANPNFQMEIFLSRPDSEWQGRKGRIDPKAIKDAVKACEGKLSLYTCGPGPVMEMAVESGKANGIPKNDCHMEAFAPPKEKLPDNCLPLERMKEIDILGGLSDKVLERLQPHIMIRKFRPREVIVREGDFGNSAFYILDGQVAVHKTSVDLIDQPKKKPRSAWERFKRLLRKNPRGNEFIAPHHFKVTHTSINTEGHICDHEGKTLVPFFIPENPRDLEGNPIPESKIISLPRGEIFGELAALFRYKRNATVTAGKDYCQTLELKIQALRILSTSNKEFGRFIEDRFRQRSLSRFLKDATLLKDCEFGLLEMITQKAKFHSFKPQQIILEEGDSNHEIYFILSGYVKLSQKFDSSELNFQTLKKGDFFGEFSLLSDGPSICSITAINNVQVVGLEKEIFNKIMEVETSREIIEQTVKERTHNRNELRTRMPSLSLLSFGIDHELVNGQSIMVINLDRCTRCDDCVKACADSHEGYPRFAREGKKIGNTLFPHSCMHCMDPLCMDGCPSGALHRSREHGEVLIDIDVCIGCTMCVTNCIYDNIVALPVAENVGSNGDVEFKKNPSNNKPILKSMKCDLCVETGDPACVRSCPQDAMKRLSFNDIFQTQI